MYKQRILRFLRRIVFRFHRWTFNREMNTHGGLSKMWRKTTDSLLGLHHKINLAINDCQK